MTLFHSKARMLTVLLLAVLVTPGLATAERLTKLIEERAVGNFSGVFPASGRYDIKLVDETRTEAEYIAEFWMDERSGKFIANAVSDTGDIFRIWGVATLTVPVPLPIARKLPGELVSESDIEMFRLPYARLGAFAILDREALVGMEVRRMLPANQPVARQSVMAPTLVERGEIVTIEYRMGGLHLNARGRSLADAHLGQELRVVNLSGNKTITAVARAEGVVVVER
ncbi:flagellar basal body P-ring formation chaperone FlgA [Roseovarius indicus]|uniref:flagellar basal body P-ring formation chaperone FlgA n=1 Tax=Roseovarius indicus TaxID=540747 RepID=UPI0032EB92C0